MPYVNEIIRILILIEFPIFITFKNLRSISNNGQFGRYDEITFQIIPKGEYTREGNRIRQIQFQKRKTYLLKWHFI